MDISECFVVVEMNNYVPLHKDGLSRPQTIQTGEDAVAVQLHVIYYNTKPMQLTTINFSKIGK